MASDYSRPPSHRYRCIQQAIRRHQERALNPTHPHQRGTAQGPDVYMQCVEATSSFYEATPEHVLAAMADAEAVTGRPYRLFDYIGHPQADRVVVMMGSGSQIVEEAVDYLTAQGHKVGVLKVKNWGGQSVRLMAL